MMIWRNCRKSLFVRFMLSKTSTIICILLFFILALVVGLTGERALIHSWPAVLFLLYFQTVLLFVILRGWRAKTATGARLGAVRWRFLLNHAGLLVAVASAFWGAPDSKTYRVQAFHNIPVNEVYAMDGTKEFLSYDICLVDFNIETYSNGVPSMYEADVLIDDRPVLLKVNEPYSRAWDENVYLTGFDYAEGENSRYCVIQIVREPWKYGIIAGVIMMLAGALLLFAAGPDRISRED